MGGKSMEVGVRNVPQVGKIRSGHE
ncbi:hypothetical protein LCGC14_3120500, partial [marine sediment metagenome]